MESVLLRTLKYAQNNGEQDAALRIAATRTFVSDAMDRVELKAKSMIAAVSEGDTMRTNLAALKRFTKHMPVNSIEARQAIAVKLCEVGRYIF